MSNSDLPELLFSFEANPNRNIVYLDNISIFKGSKRLEILLNSFSSKLLYFKLFVKLISLLYKKMGQSITT